MSADHLVPSSDGVVVAAHELGGSGPPLLMCHATGFHGRVWQPVADHLVSSHRCVAVDFRGHGDSRLPPGVSLDWKGMTADLLAVVTSLDLRSPLSVAGWSMGGCVLVMAQLARPATWARGWAMEPIIFSGPVAEHGRGHSLAEGARRRREVFADRDEAFGHYVSKPPFSLVGEASLRAYVDHGFDDLGDGTVRLKCRAETEAGVFEHSLTDVADRLGEIDAPLTVVASGDHGPPAQAAPSVVERLTHGTLETMDDLTHFAPMQDPARVADSIRRAVI